jgi:hypothetical protein
MNQFLLILGDVMRIVTFQAQRQRLPHARNGLGPVQPEHWDGLPKERMRACRR